jgi:hypothetical protein
MGGVAARATASGGEASCERAGAPANAMETTGTHDAILRHRFFSKRMNGLICSALLVQQRSCSIPAGGFEPIQATRLSLCRDDDKWDQCDVIERETPFGLISYKANPVSSGAGSDKT